MDSTGACPYLPRLFFYTWRPHDRSAAIIISPVRFKLVATAAICSKKFELHISTHARARRLLHPELHRLQRCQLSRFVHMTPGQTETVKTDIHRILTRP